MAGVISECPLQRKCLSGLLSRYGLRVSVSCAPGSLVQQTETQLAGVDCWLIDLTEDEACEPVMELLDRFDPPVLFGPGRAPLTQGESYPAWERRLIAKLERFLATLTDGGRDVDSGVTTTSLPPLAREVWVLAASLGGPGAVKRFLDALPEDIPAGFYYAQHIDDGGARVLTQVLARHSNLELQFACAGSQLREGQVQMVPVNHQIRFSDTGIVFLDEAWTGPYGPSIDQFLIHTLAYYGNRCNVIVFSGMGNDGAAAIPAMKLAGCQVWTQSPESCATDSMPGTIIGLGCSDFTGTPEVLAQALIQRLKRRS
jgi:chemosensory pili system protein ChpB (putative protein-glutamate methylesterase)